MAETIFYNGCKYEILEDKKLRLCHMGINSELYIPKFAMVNGERYEVIKVGGYKEDYYETIKEWQDDKRRKPIEKTVKRNGFCRISGAHGYENEYRVESIVFPDTVQIIGDEAFVYFEGLKSVRFSDTLKIIGKKAFYSCGIEELDIPDSVTEIGDRAFNDCRKLKTVKIGRGVTRIGAEAFSECSSLESLIIPDSVTEIGDNAFYDCKNLKTVKIGRGITYIGRDAFNYRYRTFEEPSLAAVDIYNDPFEVSVGNNAFYYKAKVNYLGKDAAPKDTAKAEKPEEPKATTPVTIDLDKLIEAVIADGVITDKERSVIIKKATAAGYDAEEVEILLDGKLAEKLSQSIPNTLVVEETKPEAKPQEKTSVIQEEKPATDTVKSEVAKKETSTKSKSKQSSVSYEDYVVTINEDKSISVTLKGDLCDNTKKALREIAELVGFEVDDKWTTRQFGSKLVAFLSEK